MHSTEFYRIKTKQRENPVAKCYPQWELNSGSQTLMPCMLISELIPCSQEVTDNRSLYSDDLLILLLREFFESKLQHVCIQ